MKIVPRKHELLLKTFYFLSSKLSNGHSPQIRQNGELLARMCRGESHFSQRWRMSNVSECIESGEMVGECRANVSSPTKTGWRMSANVSSPAKTAEMAILASTRIRQTGKFSASTRIRQIRRRVAIA